MIDKREQGTITARFCDKCSITEYCKYYRMQFTINFGTVELKTPYGCTVHTSTGEDDKDSIELHLR